jgi:AraC-like DNA-binding protein
MSRLIELAADLSGTHDFGLRLAAKRRLSHLGALGLALREQPNLRKAFSILAEYAWLQNEAMTVHLEELDEVAVLTVGAMAWRGRQANELLVGNCARIIQSLRGPTWRPLEVRFLHAPPGTLDAHRRFFGISPLFEQDFLGLVLARADLDAPIAAADPVMERHTARYIEHLAAGRRKDLTGKVIDAILLLLPTGGCTADRTAKRLSMDRRTLHRRLAAAGTSFTQLLEDARGELAASLLASTERPLQSVAELLGFASLSAFGHWFRRRFECTASAYRATQMQPSAPALSRTLSGVSIN